MQASERTCRWNHQYNNAMSDSPPSSMNTKALPKGALASTPYLLCTQRQACQSDASPQAKFYCPQCQTLQCTLCEQQMHDRHHEQTHNRLNLDEMDDECCSLDRSHPAVVYCSTCALSFCQQCYDCQHQHADGRLHKPQKCGQVQRAPNKK